MTNAAPQPPRASASRRILLVGVPGFNRGDDAISAGMVQALLAEHPEARLTVAVLRRGVHRHERVKELLIQRRSPLFHWRLLRSIWRSESVVIGGGSIIQDEFGAGWLSGIMGLFVEVTALAAWLGKPVRTAPIGVDGLHTDKGRRIARFILSRCSFVAARDAVSQHNAQALLGGTAGVLLAADPALAIGLRREAQAPAPNEPSLLVLCPAFERANRTPTALLFAGLARDFLRAHPQGRVALLAMEEREHEDAGHLQKVVELLETELRERVQTTAPTQLDEALAVLRRARWLITMRLHPMILAAQAVPTLCLARGGKMRSIAAEMSVTSIALKDTSLEGTLDQARAFIASHLDSAARECSLHEVGTASAVLQRRWHAYVAQALRPSAGTCDAPAKPGARAAGPMEQA